ncbi:MAG TPA: hypothetical protein VLE46_07305 [Nitrospira sp.]|nr:hypothetical protein [Nitrospira sp.]
MDDEEAILGLCAVILERAGFRVLKAKTVPMPYVYLRFIAGPSMLCSPTSF